jgi:signal transduction histidine kinase/ActR/RegA family two-component response regulator
MGTPDYQALFEATPGLYLVLDPELRIVAASDALLRATLVSRAALVGRPVFEAFPAPSDDGQQDAAKAALDEVLRTRQPQAIANLRYPVARPADLGGGFEEHSWSVLYSPVLDAAGQLRAIIVSVDDVTGAGGEDSSTPRLAAQAAVSARRQAEASGQAARLSEDRYRSLFESLDAGFCVIEMIYDASGKPVDYRFLEVNAAFERQTGLKEPMTKTMREHVPDHEQHWFDTYGRIAASGEPQRFVHAAESLMGGWYEVYAYRVGGPGSRMVAVLFNDITVRVHAEQALKDADRRKNEFLATLAHELRNPLAPIRNALSVMRLNGSGDEEFALAHDIAERQVAHLVRLVDDLLDVSRITFGKVELRRRRLDLRDVAQDALATSKPALDAAGHRLTLRIDAGPLWMNGDATRLTQVISNLLNNAARYTPHGGEVVLEVQRASDQARISVEDNGIGIAPEMLARVFEPFVQAGTRGSGQTPAGIGIGLSLARMLTELHGGHIGAESKGVGRGSRFTVCLPLAEAAPAKPADAPRPARSRVAHRFLVVDDNADVAASQAQLLRMLGHEVETANGGEQALRIAARYRPEVVLLDLGMPGMDGFEVARALRRMPELDEALLIAQTGWGQEEDRRRTAAAGFDAHLAKPVDVDALMQEIARLRATSAPASR